MLYEFNVFQSNANTYNNGYIDSVYLKLNDIRFKFPAQYYTRIVPLCKPEVKIVLDRGLFWFGFTWSTLKNNENSPTFCNFSHS